MICSDANTTGEHKPEDTEEVTADKIGGADSQASPDTEGEGTTSVVDKTSTPALNAELPGKVVMPGPFFLTSVHILPLSSCKGS